MSVSILIQIKMEKLGKYEVPDIIPIWKSKLELVLKNLVSVSVWYRTCFPFCVFKVMCQVN